MFQIEKRGKKFQKIFKCSLRYSRSF